MNPPEKPAGKLRTGFTTGTSATASSVAAILSIVNQKKLNRLMFYFQKKLELRLISTVVNSEKTMHAAQ